MTTPRREPRRFKIEAIMEADNVGRVEEGAGEEVEGIPAIVEEAEEEEEEVANNVAETSPYAIAAIQEEQAPPAAEKAPDASTEVGLTTAATSNMRPLVALSGEMSDWMECANADGDTFYYHVVTGETTWIRPLEVLPPATPLLSARHTPSEATAATYHYSSHSDLSESLPAGEATPSTGEGAEGEGVHRFVKRVLDGSLRRLDPHTQMQLEEARRRHRELEELRDEEVLMGGEHWIEMYDPTHEGFYYYGVQSGEMRWDRPDSYVMKVESDDVLRVVVRLQCVFRMKLARRKVFMMKIQRGLIPSGEIDSLAGSNPWVEVYDPFHKVLYYYCATTGETRWDPPEHFISAAEDREMAAAIAIQSMSRSHLARREVKKRKTTIRKKQHEQAMDEARKLREIRRKEYFAKTDDERESMCRREMLEEEMEQIREGDLFWGVDKHDQEVVRQLMEEKMLADAEAFWQRVNMTLRLRVEMERQRTHEEEAQRQELELISEANEMDRMRAAEADQCRLGDCFWGIQAEEQGEARARVDMDAEEIHSRLYGVQAFVEDQYRAWEDERDRRVDEDAVNKVVNEKKNQRQYFKWFYSKCQTAEDVMDYLWPTNQRFNPSIDNEVEEGEDVDNQLLQSEENERPSQQARPQIPKEPPYLLDDKVVRQRLETEYRYGNKPMFTVHDPNSARVLGLRGQYVFHRVDTDSVFAKAAKKAETNPRPTSPTRPMPASSKPIPNDNEFDEEERIRYGMFPALHYRHIHGPDPHLPARYNGVPYHPSDLNPTREILMAHHTKLTKLPSLMLSPSKLAKKTKSPLPSPQAKTKDPRRKHSSLLLAMQSSNNNTVDPLSSSLGFASPFYRQAQEARQKSFRVAEQKKETQEERDARAAHENAQRIRRKYSLRFEREELPVVWNVFRTMDLDGSGTINKKEMVWALQRDGEVHSIARRSALLRLLLKQQSHLEELFKHLRMSDMQREEISWDVFRIFCEEMYISLVQQGLLDPPIGQSGPQSTSEPTKSEEGPQRDRGKSQTASASSPPRRGRLTRKGSVYVENNEEKLIRQVFALCDQDGNGVLEVDELQQALYTNSNPDLQRLVRNSKALQPLLHQHTFIDAFRKFEPSDPRGISEEEFVVFCLEIADIAMLNGML